MVRQSIGIRLVQSCDEPSPRGCETIHLLNTNERVGRIPRTKATALSARSRRYPVQALAEANQSCLCVPVATRLYALLLTSDEILRLPTRLIYPILVVKLA